MSTIKFSRKATIVSNYEAAIAALNNLTFYAAMPAYIGYLDGDATYYLLAVGLPTIGASGASGSSAYSIICKTKDAEVLERFKFDGDGTKFLADNGEWVNIESGVISVNERTGAVTVVEGMLLEPITVAGVTVGNITTGTELPVGMTFTEFIKQMMIKQIPPTYSAPSVAFTAPTSNSTLEVGTTINLTLTSKFTQNDAGAVATDGHKITRKVGNGSATVVATGSAATLSFTENSTVVGDASADATVVYNSSVTYAQGPIKQDNLGEDYPTGRIEAGTKNASSTRTVTGKRCMFFGSFAPGAWDATSAKIRSMRSKLNPIAGTSIGYSEFPVAAGDQIFVIAIPTSYNRTIRQVLQNANGFNLNVTEKFVKQSSTVLVEGVNGYTSVEYDVYIWDPGTAFSDPDSFKIDIN